MDTAVQHVQLGLTAVAVLAAVVLLVAPRRSPILDERPAADAVEAPGAA